MADPAKRLATYEDLLNAPAHTIAQLIDGQLHLQPRPAGPHAFACSGLGSDLGQPFQRGRGGPGGWILIDELELHVGHNVLVPDLAAWRVEAPPELEATFFTVVPVWICEVVSPSSAAFDRGPKMDVYLQWGVEYAWLVDPLENLIEAYHSHQGAWVRLGAWLGQVSARIPPFDAIDLALGPLWVKQNPKLE